MKKKFTICLILTFSVMLSIVAPAFADYGYFTYYFENLTATQDSSITGIRAEAKGRDWWFYIWDGNVSTSRVLGVRPRKGKDGNYGELGPYKLCKTVKAYDGVYSQDVAKGKTVITRAKKDSSSTSSGALWANGTFRP